MNKNRRKAPAAALAAALVVSGPGAPRLPLALAAVPQTITYQGSLKQNGLVVNGVQSMVFNLYATPAGGAVLWTSGPMSVAVSTGVFQVLLQPGNVDWENTNPWLETVVAGTALSPRQQLTTVPYSLDALMVSGKRYTGAASAPASPGAGDLWFNTGTGALSYWSGTTWGLAAGQGTVAGTMTVVGGAFSVGGSTLAVVNGSVGIGTTNPATALHVVGSITSSALNAANGAVYADSTGKLLATASGGAGTLCLISTNGGTPTFSSCSGSSGAAWSALSNPSANLSLSMGGNTSLLTWNDSSANNLFTLADTAGNTGTGTLLKLATNNAGRVPFNVTANGTNALFVNPSGSVGLGTAAPAYKLHAAGDAFVSGQQITGGTLTVQGNAFSVGGSTFSVVGGTVNVDNGALTVGSGGNVGIGTTNPGTTLNVVNTASGHIIRAETTGANAQIAIKNNGTGGGQWTIGAQNSGSGSVGPAGSFSIRDESVGTRVIVDAAGNVGIGTTGPGYKLDVQGGQVNASGGLCIAGACQTSWTGGNTPWTAAGSVVDLTTPGNNVVVQSTLTVQGNAFSVGGSTFSVVGGTVNVDNGTLTVGSGGYVGIGTTSPLYQLHTTGTLYVASNSIVSSTLTVQGNAFSVGGSTFSVAGGTVNVDNGALTVGSGGNVGVGTTSPGFKLDVQGGQINASGGLCIANVCQTSWAGGNTPWSRTAPNVSLTNAGDKVGLGTALPAAQIHVSSSPAAGQPSLLIDGNAATSLQIGVSTFTVTGGGNVGIGTTSPGALLDVSGDGSTVLLPRKSTAGDPASPANGMMYYNSNGGAFRCYQGGLWQNCIAAGSSQWTTSGSNIYYNTGNVGIGTAAPTYKLQVTKTAVAVPAMMIGGGFAGGPRLQVYGLDADALAYMGLGTDMGGGPYEHSIYTSAPAQSGKITFGQYDGTTFTERMRINGSGNVGIGTTSPGVLLHVAGGAGVLLRLAGTGGICDHTPGAASETVACSSDERLKTDISDASPVLGELARLKIKQYKIKSTGELGVGVIAQEVRKAAPELVKEGPDGYLMVSQIPHWKLIKAIQEQQAEIEDLRKELRELRAK